MAFNFKKWFDAILTAVSPPTPTPPPPNGPVSVCFAVRGLPLDSLPRARLRTDGGHEYSCTYDGGPHRFTCSVPDTEPPHGVEAIVAADGYTERRVRFVLAAHHLPITQDLDDVYFTPVDVTPPEPVTKPDPTPPWSTDAIDLTRAQVAAGDCPDVRTWPLSKTINSLTIADHEAFQRGNTMIQFDGRDDLPVAMGSQGAIAYTLWMGCLIQSRWHILPIVECIKDYVPTGNLLEPGHIGPNLLYFATSPLNGYQPNPHEAVIFFATSGDTRRQNVQAPGETPWRTNVMRVPFAPGHYTATLVH